MRRCHTSSVAWPFNVQGPVGIALERLCGFSISGNVSGREGYPRPLETRTALLNGGRKWAQAVADPEDFRYDDVYTVDLRFDKEVALTGNLSLNLGADLFNVFNSGVVLETLSPRIWRLGVRLNWR